MAVLSSFILFVVSCAVLVYAAGRLIRYLTHLAGYFHLSDFLGAFVIMAFSTSIPELFVGINAALAGVPVLALGTVIGSNIADLTLVIGVAALLGRGITIKNQFIRKDAIFMFFIMLTPLVLFVFDGVLSRIDGLLLLLLFVVYTTHLIKHRRGLQTSIPNHLRISLTKTIIGFVICLVALFAGAHFAVIAAESLAIAFAVPPILIGLFLLALGTSLPELVFESRAVLAHKADLAVGDTMGSVVCNSTLVLGVTALIMPIHANFMLFLTSGIVMVLVTALFVWFLRSRKGLSVQDALIMVLLYVFFLLIEFFVRTRIV